MSRTIRISQESYDRIKAFATPFETFDTVLSRVIHTANEQLAQDKGWLCSQGT